LTTPTIRLLYRQLAARRPRLQRARQLHQHDLRRQQLRQPPLLSDRLERRHRPRRIAGEPRRPPLDRPDQKPLLAVAHWIWLFSQDL
jgi:hypothetical protein